MIRNTLLLFILAGSCLAQDSTRFDKLVPRHAIKFAPLPLMNFYPTIELSFEQKITKRFSVQAGYGYVLNYKFNHNPEFQNKRGYKLKFDIRYYILPNVKYGMAFYVSTGGYMNAVDFDRETVRQECFDLSCDNTFTRYYYYVAKYREYGGTVRFGFVKHFSKSIFMDFNGGWALRFIHYDDPMAPANNFDDTFIFFSNIPNEEDRVGLLPVLSFSFGYRFR